VIGVAKNRPGGPHSHVQKTVEIITASGDNPVLAPKSMTSTMLAVTNSAKR